MHTPFGEVDCIAGELIGRITTRQVTGDRRPEAPGQELCTKGAAAGASCYATAGWRWRTASSEPNGGEWQCFFKSAFFEKDLRCDA